MQNISQRMLPNHCYSIWACIFYTLLTTSYKYTATLPLSVQYSYLFHTDILNITRRREHHRFTRSFNFNRLSPLGSLVPLSDYHLPYWDPLVPRRSTPYSSLSHLLTLLHERSFDFISSLLEPHLIVQYIYEYSYYSTIVKIRFHTDSIQWVLLYIIVTSVYCANFYFANKE